jgi:cysteine desulfurase
MQKPVYLDHHATTPLDARVLEAMLPYFGAKFGNAASKTHSYGWEAEKAVDRARQQVAELAGAEAREIVFTSGATESINLAIKGAAAGGGHVVTVSTEHKAVLDTVKRLPRVTVIPVGTDGLVDPAAVRDAIEADTVLVCVMYANNEIGVIQAVREIGELCRERGIWFHCDAAQAFGKIPMDAQRDDIHLMSLSAHKLYGPKGIGALYVRRKDPRVRLDAQIDGGGHEFGMRSGTLNVPGIVGFGEACAIAAREMAEESARLLRLRERLRAEIEASVEGARINGSLEHRLAGNLNVTFPGVDADALLMNMPDLALSTGSACSSATVEPSHVLRAIGLSTRDARSSVRFGLGRFTTEEEIDYAASRVIESVRKLRALAPIS